jgi:hypothetical protein
MVVVLRKLVPMTVRVSGPAPAIIVVGLIEVTVGEEEVVVVPPELDEDPPQLERRTDTPRQRGKASSTEFFIREVSVKGRSARRNPIAMNFFASVTVR